MQFLAKQMTSADNLKTTILSSAPSELDLTPITLGNSVESFHVYQKHIFYGPQLKTSEKKDVRLLFGSQWLENGIAKEMQWNLESLSGAFSSALWMSPCLSICLSWLSKCWLWLPISACAGHLAIIFSVSLSYGVFHYSWVWVIFALSTSTHSSNHSLLNAIIVSL